MHSDTTRVPLKAKTMELGDFLVFFTMNFILLLSQLGGNLIFDYIYIYKKGQTCTASPVVQEYLFVMSLESLPRPIHGGKTRVIVDDLVYRSGTILFSLFSEELRFNSLCYCYFNFNSYYYFFVLDPFIEVLFFFQFHLSIPI